MPRPRQGTFEPVTFSDGRTVFRGCLRIAYGTKSDRFDLPADMNERQARAYLSGLQAEEDASHAVFNAKEDRLREEAQQRGESVGGDAWVAKWLAERERRGLTACRTNKFHYDEHIRPSVLKNGEPKHIRDWSTDDMRALSRALDGKVQRGELKWKTAWNVWGTVHRMCRDACTSKHDEIRVRADNPITTVARPDRGEQTAKQFLYPSEFLTFVSCKDVPIQWRRVVALAIYLFPRAGEMRALRWEDVDIKHGTIHVHRARNREDEHDKGTKTKAGRRFAIEPGVLPFVKAMHDESGGEGHIIELPNDKHLARDLRQWLSVAGVDREELHTATSTRKAMTFHDLRATGLTWLAVRGDDPLKIMQRAGHADFGTTQGYIRMAEAVRDGFGQVFPTLPSLIGGGPFGPNNGPNDRQVSEIMVEALGIEF